jgi:alpha-amylase
VTGFLQRRGRTVAFDRYLQARERVRPGFLLAHFLSSHDVPGALHLLGGDRDSFRLAALLQFTAAGVPVVYYGEEVARAGGDWPENRSDMPWGDRTILPGTGLPRDEAMRVDYRRLIGIRRAHPSLWRGRREPLARDGDLLVFARHDEASGDVTVVAVNRGDSTAALDVPLPNAWTGLPVNDAWRNTAAVVREGRLTTELRSRQGAIFVAAKQQQ